MNLPFSDASAGAIVRRGAGVLVTALLLMPRTAGAQVSSFVDVRDGHGSAVVRNGSGSLVSVDVALWESDEGTRPLKLLRKARGNLWPVSFELAPGETQVVRISIGPDAYPDGTLLRLETRLVPELPTSGGDDESERNVRVMLATRMLSKVFIRQPASHRTQSDRP